MKSLSDALPEATTRQIQDLEDRFPAIPSPYKPCGKWCVIQDRGVVEKTRGGIFVSEVSNEANEYQENIGRVVAVGPLAGYDELSSVPGGKLPDWPHFELGDLVLCSRMSSTRVKIVEADGRKANFRLIPFQDIMSVVTSVEQVLGR